MSRWTEVRGYTLALSSNGVTRYVRLALVSRRTLLGAAYNVREARAERRAEVAVAAAVRRHRDAGQYDEEGRPENELDHLTHLRVS